MLKLTNVKTSLDDESSYAELAAKKLRIEVASIKSVQVLNKAIDARKKSQISFVYSFLLEVENEQKLLQKNLANNNLTAVQAKKLEQIVYGPKELQGRVVVVGAGPAGLVCALFLAEHGYKPLLLERGLSVDERRQAVNEFWRSGRFSPVGNVQFGEGGAGTFSDGKLTTRVNDPAAQGILRLFTQCGAPEQILYEHKPHVGTDKLHVMTKNLAGKIKSLGGQIKYLSKLEDVTIADNAVKQIKLADGTVIECGALVLATGHSARDTYQMLYDKGFAMEAKPFSLGVRIEHPQQLIDKAQYGELAGHPKLGAADYALVFHDKASGRSAYSFCMCPGGVVVASASEENQVVTNGMSYYQRNSGLANSALVVGVGPSDFGQQPLAGIDFQRKWEHLAYAKAGSNYQAPAQSVGSFLRDGTAQLGELIQPSYRPGVLATSLREVLPAFVTQTLAQALLEFGKKIKNFDDPGALLTGVETRTSAPVRILREPESRQAVGIGGVYPVGEGAGYAGGIMSAAIDGYYTAVALMQAFKQP